MTPRGATKKREKEYEDLKRSFVKQGRYKGRETEVAARIVNKQRAEAGETKQAKGEGGRERSEQGTRSSRGRSAGRQSSARQKGGGLPCGRAQDEEPEHLDRLAHPAGRGPGPGEGPSRRRTSTTPRSPSRTTSS